MGRLPSVVLVAVCALAPTKDLMAEAVAGSALAPTTKVGEAVAGSRLPTEENLCLQCHSEKDLWDEKDRRLYISLEGLAHDLHFQKGVNCHDCHGGNPKAQEVNQAHATEDGFRKPLLDAWKSCTKCHGHADSGLRAGLHGEAEKKDAANRGAPLDCRTCHGPKAHGMLAIADSGSPVSRNGQIKSCGNCHREGQDTYMAGTHGQALQRAGLSVTAVCTDCHGAHAVFATADDRSPLSAANVAATCGKCHELIVERLQKSIHRRDGVPGEGPPDKKAEKEAKEKPTCIFCHPRHDSPPPESAGFRLGVPDRCATCHEEYSGRYEISIHGSLTELGYGPGAMCADCHGAHDVLPVSDPASTMSQHNRLATCQKCHAEATAGFIDFDPHADHHDPQRDPVLFGVYVVLMTFLISTFGFFGLHSVLWFFRGLVDVLKRGRPKPLKPGDVAFVRFKPFHRVAHIIMVMSFLGLAATGLPLKYSHTAWAKILADALGGFARTAEWHRLFGVVNVGCLVVYLVRMLSYLRPGAANGGPLLGRVFGPNSPVPTFRDAKDVLRMLRWFVGRGPKPTFERWAYWEKFDFWGACADIVIIGSTGLILWFPDFFCTHFSGRLLNIAKVIHSTQALLATGFVFAIHFFATHLRPERFPMDKAVLTGLVSEEELLEERPEYVDRMRREGKLDGLLATVPSRDIVGLITFGGFVALAIGAALLVGILLGAIAG